MRPPRGSQLGGRPELGGQKWPGRCTAAWDPPRWLLHIASAYRFGGAAPHAGCQGRGDIPTPAPQPRGLLLPPPPTFCMARVVSPPPPTRDSAQSPSALPL